MARISTYDQDSTLNKLDKVLGTDSATGNTKNYTIDSVVGLINNEDLIKIFDGVPYSFKSYEAGSGSPQGIINLNAGTASQAAFSAINQIYISVLDKNGNTIADYLDDTINSFVRVVQKGNVNVYGVFEVTAVANHDNNAYKLLTVTPRINNGNITPNEEYFVSNYSAVFDQDFSDDSVTEFGDVTSAGSGAIITVAERNSLTSLGTNALLHSDVVDNVTTTTTDVPLSANQGKLLKDEVDAINTLLTSDNVNLDTLQEVVDFIEANKDSLDNLSISNIAGLQTALDGKVNTVTGKGLSTEDFTTALLTKLNNVSANGEENVQVDFNESDSSSDAFILNKPTDLTVLSSHSVTELSDVTSTGSGAIITSAERNSIDSSHGTFIGLSSAERTKLSGIDVNTSTRVITDGTDSVTVPPADATATSTANVVAALTAGSNISISSGGVIAATDTNTNTTYDLTVHDSGDNAIVRLTGSDSTTDDVTFVAGNNVTLTPNSSNLNISVDLTTAAVSDGSTSLVTGDHVFDYANPKFARKDQAETFTNDVTIQGNLTVSGTTTTVNTTELNIADSIITLNSDLASVTAPSLDAGIEINRGSATDVKLIWHEGDDKWKFTNDGSTYYAIPTGIADLNASLNDLTDVTIASVANDQILRYNSTSSRWENEALTTDAVSEGSTNLYDKTVALSNGGNMTITGSYPNFTLSSSHPTISGAASDSSNSGSTFIQSLTFDSNGHVTGVSTGTAAGTNTTYGVGVEAGASNTSVIRLTGSDSSTDDITLSGGSNVSITESGDTITIASAHPSISGATSVNNSGFDFIQDITVDSNGHVTNIGTTAIGTGSVTSIATTTLATGAEIHSFVTGQGYSTFDGAYSSLTGTPTIPTNNNQLTNGAGYTTFDGAYSSLTGTPTIPTNNNQLTNGAGYTTFDGDYNSLSNTPTIPTNNNQLTNGAGYTTNTGTVTASGTPSSGQFAQFTSATDIQGRSVSQVQSDLSLEVGTDVQAFSSTLTTIAGLPTTSSGFIVGTGSSWTVQSLNNARTSLGLGNGDNVQHQDITATRNVVIQGNLTVSGTTTTINTNTLNIGDNIITLNSDETGTPSQNAGIEVERGTGTNVALRWNETTDKWQFTNDGTTYSDIGTSDALESTGTIDNLDYARFDSNGDLTGRSYSEVKADLSLNNVENTAISTFAGSSNIVTVGTIGTGTWQGTAIADSYIASAATWNAIDTAVPAIYDNSGTPAFNTGITKAEVLSILNVEDGADVTDTTNVVAALTAGTNITIAGDGTISSTDTNTQLSTEEVQDIAGPLVATGGTKTGITVTYDDANGNMDFVVATQSDENFTSALLSKLNNIEASADVTDTANVTAAGALMDSELTDLAGVKGVTISTLQVKPSEGAFADGDKTKLDGIETGATADQTQSDINALAITEVGTITSGIWNGSIISTTYLQNQSGTNTGDEADASESVKGIVELATTAEALDGTDTTRAVTPAGLAARSYVTSIGDASNTSFTVTHDLGTRDVIVQLYDASSYETVFADVTRTTVNTLTIAFTQAPSSNDIRVLVTKID